MLRAVTLPLNICCTAALFFCSGTCLVTRFSFVFDVGIGVLCVARFLMYQSRGSDDARRRSTRNRSRSRTGARLGTGTRVEDGQAKGWSTAYGTWEPTPGGEGRTGDAQGGTELAREKEEVWTARR